VNNRHKYLASTSRSRGVTLIELMVAMAIGLAIIAGIGYVYLQGREGFRTQDSQSRLQEDVRFITEIFTRDIRNARYMGCLGMVGVGSSTSVGDTSPLRFTGEHPWFTDSTYIKPSKEWLMLNAGDTTSIGGLRSAGVPNLAYVSRGFDNGSGWPATSTLTSRLQPNTDVFMFMKIADEGRAIKLPLDTALEEFEINGDPIPGYTSDGKIGVLAVSSCTGGTEIVKATVQQGGKKFSVANTYNKSPNPDPDPANPEIERLVFPVGPGAIVAPFEPVAYYIGSGANNKSGMPALYRVGIADRLDMATERSGTGLWDASGGQLLAAGVENMQLTYLLDGQYLTATAIDARGDPNNDWSAVRAIKVILTIASLDDKVRTQAETQTLKSGGTATDRRIRQEVSFVVELPNSAL
jgi:type IV pilus assembly protein PilW